MPLKAYHSKPAYVAFENQGSSRIEVTPPAITSPTKMVEDIIIWQIVGEEPEHAQTGTPSASGPVNRRMEVPVQGYRIQI